MLAVLRHVYGDETLPLIQRERSGLSAIGISDSEVYAQVLERGLDYRNTFLHKAPYLDLCDPNSVAQYTALDLIICSDVLEHTRQPPSVILNSLWRMLRPGGLVILSAPTYQMPESIERYYGAKTVRVVERDNQRIVEWEDGNGVCHIDPAPRFHGGSGDTLEMRIISHRELLSAAERAGFTAETLEFCEQAGYFWRLVPEHPSVNAALDGRVIILRRITDSDGKLSLERSESQPLPRQPFRAAMQTKFDNRLIAPLKTRSKSHYNALADYVEGQRNWFHVIEFEGGLVTPGHDPSAKKLYHLCLPPSLAGMSVLDIGAFEGYFSFHAEARGATRVVALDSFMWEWPDSPAFKNFNMAREAIGSKVETIISTVEDMPAKCTEKFDIVLFLGVLYHAPNMVEYLRNCYAVTSQVCVIETLVDCLDAETAAAAYYPSGTLNNDSSNWWGPNLKTVTEMCQRVGFRHVEFVNLWDINTVAAIRQQDRFGALKSGRIVLHCYK